MENRLPGFLVSVCLHLTAAALLIFAPKPDFSPVPAGGIAVSGYVTLGKPGAAPRKAKEESAAGGGPVLPEKMPPPPPDASASATPKTPPAPPEAQTPKTPPAPPEAQTPAAPPVQQTPPQETVKSVPDAPLRDPAAVPVPQNPEKATPQKKVEAPKPPQKAEAPKKTEPAKKTEPPKKADTQKKPPAATTPQKDTVAGALAELSREVGKSNARRGGPGTQPQGDSRSLSGALSELGKEAEGRGNGPSGSGPGGEGGDGYGVLGAYQDSVISRVRPNWSLPARADRRSYTAVVNIKIDKDGAILEARIIRSSGNGFFDASVIQAVAATKALEPPPHPDYADINISFTPESLGRR